MMKLFHAKFSIALSAQILVTELGLNVEFVEVDFQSQQQRSPEYLALNPLGRVPLLVTEHGNLTETPAILSYLAEQAPNRGLVPASIWDQARVNSAMSFLASTAHVSFAHGRRGHRWTDDPVVVEQLKEKVPHNMREAMRILLESHFSGPFVLGEQLSVADFHLFTLLHWLGYAQVDVAEFPALAAHYDAMCQRASVKRWL